MKELTVLRDEIKTYLNAEPLNPLLETERESFADFVQFSLKLSAAELSLQLRFWIKAALEKIKKDPQKELFQHKFAEFYFKIEAISAFNEYSKTRLSDADNFILRSRLNSIQNHLLHAKSITKGFESANKFFSMEDKFSTTIAEIYSRYRENAGETKPPFSARSLLAALFGETKKEFKEKLGAHSSLLQSFKLLSEHSSASEIIKWIKAENKKLNKNDVERKKWLAEFRFKLEVLQLLEKYSLHSSEKAIKQVILERFGKDLLKEESGDLTTGRWDKFLVPAVEKRKKKYEEYLLELSKRPCVTVSMDVELVKIEVAKAPESKASFFPAVSPKGKEEERDSAASISEPACDVEALKKENQDSQEAVARLKQTLMQTMGAQLQDKLTNLSQVNVNVKKINALSREEYSKNAGNIAKRDEIAKRVAKRGWDYIPFGIGNWFAKKFGTLSWNKRRQAVEKYFEAEVARDELSANCDNHNSQAEFDFAVEAGLKRGNFKGITAESFQAIFKEISKIKANKDKITKQKEQKLRYKPYVISVVEQNGPRPLPSSYSPNSSCNLTQ